MSSGSPAAPHGALLEREDELWQIEAAVRAAVAGSGSTVVLDGPAGIGKTRLCEEVAVRAEGMGAGVLRCSGGRLEQGLAFGVVRSLLTPALASLDQKERDEVFAGAAQLGLRTLGLEPAESGDFQDAGEGAFFGLFWVCANLAERGPILLVVDDAQWLDSPSLSFLAYLGRRLEDLPVALLVAVRSGDPDASSAALVELRSGEHSFLVSLGELSPQATAALVRERMGADAQDSLAEACHASSGGNPFLLSALLDHLIGAGEAADAEQVAALGTATPDSVRAWIATRLERLGPDADRLAKAVAVFGEPTESHLCARLAGVGRGRLLETVGSLREASVLSDSGPLAFAHPLVGESVAALIRDHERSELELETARLLADEAASADKVAAHLLAVEPGAGEWVLERLVVAGREALAAGASEGALVYLKRATREPEAATDPVLWRTYAQASVAADPADQPVEHALELARTPEERGKSALLLLQLRDTQGRSEQAVPVLETVLAQLPAGALRARVEAGLISAAQLHSTTRQMGVERLMAAGERIGEDEPSNFGEASILANLAFGGMVSCIADAERAVAMAERALTGDWLVEEHAIVPVSYVAAALLFSGRAQRTREVLDAAIDSARRSGNLVARDTLTGIKAAATLQIGRAAEAVVEAELARGDLRGEAWAEVPVSVAPMLEALYWRGELDRAVEVASSYPLESAPDTPYSLRAVVSWARVLAARGDREHALEILLDAGDRLDSMGIVHPVMADWRGPAARLCAALGREPEAERHAHAQLDLAHRSGSAVAIGCALLTAGRLAGGSEAIERLEDALDALSGTEALLHVAEARIEFGSALRRARRRTEAVEQLRAGVDLAARGQVTALTERGRDELVRAGLKPRREHVFGPEALTPSERKVAELAVSGKRNREIAQELFVTVRTVETHLTHVYTKLEISSRKELPEALSA